MSRIQDTTTGSLNGEAARQGGQNLTCSRYEALQVFEHVYREVTRGKQLYYANVPFDNEGIAAHLASQECNLCLRWSRNARRTCQRLLLEGKLPSPEAKERSLKRVSIAAVPGTQQPDVVYGAEPVGSSASDPGASLDSAGLELTCRATTTSSSGWELHLSFNPDEKQTAQYDGTLVSFRLTSTSGKTAEFEARLDVDGGRLVSSPCPLKGIDREEIGSILLHPQPVIATGG